ncbi:MAG: hypothetical protein U1A27_14080 [Phycisphaerae bacterium]
MSHRLTLRAIALVGIGLACLAPGARADWNPGDAYKMHYPQLPNPSGWDVDFTFPQFLADDWRCTQTGPVSDVHFWFSFHEDRVVPVQSIHLSIHSDIPADATHPFSRPGDLLWERDFSTISSGVIIRPYGTGVQGWYEPKAPAPNWVFPDHNQFFQANIVNIPQPFIQDVGTIYWLDISVVLGTDPTGQPGQAGWKTSLDHFNDDAVWAHFQPGAPFVWNELRDPITQQSLDLAFVITPEPSVIGLLGLGALLMRVGRRPR